MNSGISPEDHLQADALCRHGFTEPGSERMLQNMVHLAAAFCGASAILIMHDESGIWYQCSSGLSAQELTNLEPVLIQGFSPDWNEPTSAGSELRIIERLPMAEMGPCNFGMLYILASEFLALSGTQREGLRNLVLQVQELVSVKEQNIERRGVYRGPAGASFVPGLVHQLRNFVFGITANFDAFNARFTAQDETAKYRNVIRETLGRFNAFIEELREYGDPQPIVLSERPLEPLLREAVEHHQSLAVRNGVDLQLQVYAPLPPIQMDEQALLKAFICLIDLALQQETAGARLVIQAAPHLRGTHPLVVVHIETSTLNQENLDFARLFEPFYFRASGLGRLALPVARRICEAHHGTLTALRSHEGGMRLKFTVPAS